MERSRDREEPERKREAMSPALRTMLIEFRRARITEANAISDLLGLPRVAVQRDERSLRRLDTA